MSDHRLETLVKMFEEPLGQAIADETPAVGLGILAALAEAIEVAEDPTLIEITGYKVLSTSNVTGCIVNGTLFGEPFEVEGSAKRGRGDKPNVEVGTKIAVARALRSLAMRAERQANGLVKHHDDIRDAHKALAKMKAAKVAKAAKKTTKKVAAKKKATPAKKKATAKKR